MNDFNIVPATSADEDRVFEFLIKYFYRYEPLNMAVGYPGPEEKKDCASPEILKENLSFLAVLKEDPSVICGLTLNKIVTTVGEDDIWAELAKTNSGSPYEKILRFLNINNTKFLQRLKEECWDKTNTNKAFDTTMIAVRTEDRGKKIALHLMDRTMAMARETGCRWMTMECSSAYSAGLCRKLGYTALVEMPYRDFKDEEGNVVFESKPPHVACVSLVKDLDI